MANDTTAPVFGVSSAPESPARRDWIDITVRLATSWVGLFTAYVVALILALTQFRNLTKGLQESGMPQWLGIALIAAFPLLSFIFSTIPSIIEQRRIKRYAQISGALHAGYFTLRPRESEEGFERADNAHQEILRWIENTKEPVLYLTGASGTGKSSLLSAWVIPKLKRDKHVVIQVRGYQDVLARINGEILQPDLVWDKPPRKADESRSLLHRACQHLRERRLLIVVDQFEEFLILKDDANQQSLQQFLAEKPIPGLTFLLVFRPEYEGLIQDHSWPKLQIDTNRKVISPFTEKAAQEFMDKSGLTVNADLTRAVLREAVEIEQGAVGLVRPVTINLCGLVLGRFSSGLPRKFRGGLVRAFLRESLALREVRDVAGKLIPQLITGNVTKQPRTVGELAERTLLPPGIVRACLRRLGEADRAIVRPLDQQQETWEISHDFLVPLLDAIVARRTVSLWRLFRPWLPWVAVTAMGVAATIIPSMTRRNPIAELPTQGWIVSKDGATLELGLRGDASVIPPESTTVLRRLSVPLSLSLSHTNVTDLSPLREMKRLTALDVSLTKVTNLSPLRELKSLTSLDLARAKVADLSPLRELKSLTSLDLRGTNVTDLAPLSELKSLTSLDLTDTSVTDLSPLRELKSLTSLYLTDTNVTDLSPLRELKSLELLTLRRTNVTDLSPLREMKSLTSLDFDSTQVMDLSPLRELKSLELLTLSGTKVTDLSPLRELTSLTSLDLGRAKVTDLSPLHELKSLTSLDLTAARVTDLSPLRELKSLTSLDLTYTKVTDLSPLRDLKSLMSLDIRNTRVTDVSPLRDLKNLSILR